MDDSRNPHITIVQQLAHMNSDDTIWVRVAALHERIQALPKTATIKHLADHCAASIQESFPSSFVDIVHAPAGSNDGLNIVRSGAAVDARKNFSQAIGGQTGCVIDARPRRLWIQEQLSDGSHCIVILSRQDDGEYSEVDALTLRIFTLALERGYQGLLQRKFEKGFVFMLNQRVLQLNSLIDTGIEIAKLDHTISPMQLALERATSLTNATRGVGTIIDGERVIEEFRFPEGASETVKECGKEISTKFGFGGHTYVLKLHGKESRLKSQDFEQTDQMLLEALARQVHASLENRYLVQQTLEKHKIERDLAVAATIQRRILPRTLPTIEGYDIAGTTIPSVSVGGDYFDCIPLSDGRFVLAVADVAGKGVSAALLVSTFHAFLRAYLESPGSLVSLARKLNRSISDAATTEKFITACFAMLTPETGEIEILNAGHTPVYLLRNGGTVQELGAGGVPLAMVEHDTEYKVERILMSSGDRLFLYTDGVTEARNEVNELFDDKIPLAGFFSGYTPQQSEMFISELIAKIKSFAGTAQQSDDITALYLLRQ